MTRLAWLSESSQKVKVANVLARVTLPAASKDELMRELMLRHLEMEDKLPSIGASIAFADIALRIDHMHEGVITRIEIIKSLK